MVLRRTVLKDKRILNLEEELKNGDLASLERFWEYIKRSGAPLTEDIGKGKTLVTIIYREKSPLDNVVLIPPVGMRKLDECVMDKIEGTDLWHIEYEADNDIGFTYRFSPNDPLDKDWNRRWRNVQDDEFNSKYIDYIDGLSGERKHIPYVIMEKADKFKYSGDDHCLERGSLQKRRIVSKALGEERDISIYTPYGYSNSEEYGILILHDGFEFLNMLSATYILDSLISKGEIPKIIAVFVNATSNRAVDFKCSDRFSHFIGEELIDYLKAEFRISDNPRHNVIGGYSLGGLSSAYIGLNYSNIFGNVLSESGSYWYKPDNYNGMEPWINHIYKEKGKLPLSFYINVGKIEPEVTMRDTNYSFYKSLEKQGYPVIFEEFCSGHDMLYWGEKLAYGLKVLIGCSN